jgi:hypothetical protein
MFEIRDLSVYTRGYWPGLTPSGPFCSTQWPDLKKSTKSPLRAITEQTDMDQRTTDTPDQTEEDILTYEVSDEALEVASGTGHSTSWSTCRFGNPGCVGT